MSTLRLCFRRRLGLASAIGSVAIAVVVTGSALGGIAGTYLGAMPFAPGKRLATIVASGVSSADRHALDPSEVRALRSIGWPILEVGTAERWPHSYRGWADVSDGSTTTHPLVAYVTRNVLEMAGAVVPAVAADPDVPLVAMVTPSYAQMLQLEDGASPTLNVDDTWVTVIGILPASFRSPLPPLGDEHFYGTTEIQMWIIGQPENTDSYYYTPVIAVAPEANLRSLSAEVDRQMQLALGPQRQPVRYHVQPLRDAILAKQRPIVRILLLMCIGLMTMAVVNLVTVVLIRLDDARKGIAVQALLGAPAWRLWWMHCRDAAIVASVAGMLGTALAGAAAPVVGRVLPALPWLPNGNWHLWVGLGATAMVAAIAMAAVTVVFARWWRSGAYRVTDEATGPTRSLRSLSVLSRYTLAAEVIFVCLIGTPTVALDQALDGITHERPFLLQRHTLIVQFMASERLSEKLGGLPPLYQRVRQKIESIPGVQHVGFGSDAPLLNAGEVNRIIDAPGGSSRRASGLAVDGEFLRASGIALEAGRHFDQRDTKAGPPSAILSARLAMKLFGTANAVGRTIEWHGRREVVGIVEDARLGRSDAIPGTLYVPLLQEPPRRLAALVQFGGALEMHAARRRLQSLDPEQPIDRVVSTEELAHVSFADQRVYATLANLFAGCAIALGVLGLNLVVSYLSRCRRYEIAIKQAIGINTRRLAFENGQVYGLRLLWAMAAAVPASLAAAVVLAKAMAPLTIPLLQPCAITCALTLVVFTAAAMAHATAFAGEMNRAGLRAALSGER